MEIKWPSVRPQHSFGVKATLLGRRARIVGIKLDAHFDFTLCSSVMSFHPKNINKVEVLLRKL